MAEDDMENELPEEVSEELAESPEEFVGDEDVAGGATASAKGFRLPEFVGQNLKLLLIFPAAGVLLAVVVGFLMFGGGEQEPEQVVEVVEELPPPITASAEISELAEFRSELRRSNRSARNQHLRTRLGEDDLYNLAVKGELSLISGMFEHYVTTTARFYEIFRVMSNDYVERPSQLLDLFESELLPDYNATERRRRMLRRRVEHDPAVELYNRLDYIAYHDSIAVYSFHDFLTEGGAAKFARTSDLVSESKFMLADFRVRLQARLREFNMNLDVSEDLWDRYYGSWPW